MLTALSAPAWMALDSMPWHVLVIMMFVVGQRSRNIWISCAGFLPGNSQSRIMTSGQRPSTAFNSDAASFVQKRVTNTFRPGFRFR